MSIDSKVDSKSFQSSSALSNASRYILDYGVASVGAACLVTIGMNLPFNVAEMFGCKPSAMDMYSSIAYVALISPLIAQALHTSSSEIASKKYSSGCTYGPEIPHAREIIRKINNGHE